MSEASNSEIIDGIRRCMASGDVEALADWSAMASQEADRQAKAMQSGRYNYYHTIDESCPREDCADCHPELRPEWYVTSERACQCGKVLWHVQPRLGTRRFECGTFTQAMLIADALNASENCNG